MGKFSRKEEMKRNSYLLEKDSPEFYVELIRKSRGKGERGGMRKLNRYK